MKKDNPAKVFLRRYIYLCGRMDAIQRAIDSALERATSTSISLKDIKVLSSPAEHDPMAKDVCIVVDACEVLYDYKQQITEALQEILTAIDSVQDERQKEVLTRRYINGDSFKDIMTAMHYEETQIFVLHGRALVEINKWLKVRSKTEYF